MQVVGGATIKEHYWALSYSWGQSGEIINLDSKKSKRLDEGQHTLVSKPCADRETEKTQVKFERLIQQMCMDFNIGYIWYDQKCIDQDDDDEKLREIKNMHKIYENARCTLVLIPELKVATSTANINAIPESNWSKRMWTLEEAYVSKSMLFVGQNAHLWSDGGVQVQGPTKYAKFLSNIR
ncbi:heterokaryon incompatibility protein-domain-containing protein [Fennellomyces sp. T-0311]|nr:heterokaryon incompatibility protein-domain-containing protein [Fennellomyces sp. T-0311]